MEKGCHFYSHENSLILTLYPTNHDSVSKPLNLSGPQLYYLPQRYNDIFKSELDGIAANTVAVSKIVSRIIAFSKIWHQQMEINSSHFRTAELLELLIKSNDDLLNERDVKLINIYDSTTPELLYTDHELLMQSLLLIIRAVFRASEHGEIINLCCSADDEKVYTMGDVSKEICGGPHAKNTGDLVNFKIKKEESSSAGVRRIKATINN